MSWIDWLVMFGTLLLIAGYGIYKTRTVHSAASYLKGDDEKKWWEIGLSVMATQASAITFLSVPGQAYDDGLRFIQFYFGLPLAMIVIAVFFIPIFYKLKVYTAYEFLENRFDIKTRTFTAALFLIQRAFSTGITIYAPSIILSSLLDWDLNTTVVFIGGIVTLYILTGGTKAVAVTHKQQMLVIYVGMFAAFGYLVYYLSEYVTFNESLNIAGTMGKMNIITSGSEGGSFNWSDRYNIISGLIGGLFLQLSYFGTDQSQVGRYLGGESVKESRLGLIFNGLMKVPVQFFILLTGVLVFVFYQFNQPPVYFNEVAYNKTLESSYSNELKDLENKYLAATELRTNLNRGEAEDEITSQKNRTPELIKLDAEIATLRTNINEVIVKANPDVDDDSDYIFMHFVMNYLPIGLVGLLFAVIFSASMSSTSSALNGLATTFSVDIYKRLLNKNVDEKQHLFVSKLLTVIFGAMAVGFALICSMFDNLIEAVNILGSLFYGTILGIFLTAFLIKRAGGNATFIAALFSECIILYLDFSVRYNWNVPKLEIGYLWYNVIGCLLVMLFAVIFSIAWPNRKPIIEA
jgi:Na+/proline symporter